MEYSLNSFEHLLESAKQIDVDYSEPSNFFKVCNITHDENVASNVLAFFFDTNAKHGLKDLWIKSLLECYYEDDSLMMISSINTIKGGISREKKTTGATRIDIIIETDQNWLIAIENKLFADINNPFKKYHEWIHEQYRHDYPYIIEIVLSLSPIHDKKLITGYGNNGVPFEFINITYSQLFSAVKRNFSSYSSKASPKWLLFMEEFIDNITSLQGETMQLNETWQYFLKENNDLITEFNCKIQKDNNEKINIIKSLAISLRERLPNINFGPPIKISLSTQSNSSHISVELDITLDKHTTICIEPYFKRTGYPVEKEEHMGLLNICIWVKEPDQRSSTIGTLERHLCVNGIPVTLKHERKCGYCLESEAFDYCTQVNQEEVINHIYEIADNIVHMP